ncbi:helix-turn-helix domain-containing protein [Micromonospora sp. KC213]|uniref:helix-turn-helix domain-containing protein n=1 Tax=Micromonospora sp. KC213 TaxID=2530378 RepID=UPI0010441FB9|nr:helix-turn-helix domain-containing protein [Micromonospora sp. KC213]TDC38547.1 PucR family transcriptional regulator [Micromonospora sp. KC213]
MTTVDTGPAASFDALLRSLVTDPAAIEEVAGAARAHSPEVSRLPPAEVRRQVTTLLRCSLTALQDRVEPGERDFAEARRLGADRATQGMSVSGLLRGVQAGRDRAVELVIRHGRSAGIPDEVLLDGLITIGRYAAALEHAVVDGHRDAERDLARAGHEPRTRLVRRLLLGGPVTPTAEELTRFGLRADGSYHCLVAGSVDPVRADGLAGRLARHGAVVGMVEDRLAGLTPRLPPADRLDPTALLVAAPAGPLDRAPRMYGLCLAALRVAAGQGRRGLYDVTELAGETALAAQPALAELLGDTLLAALDPVDGFHRELVSTALTWLDHGQRLDRAGAALHVHPNTVRYRLRRLRELTGFPASAVGEGADGWPVVEILRWWWALRSWRDRR